jgi:serine/threonine-protein kinase
LLPEALRASPAPAPGGSGGPRRAKMPRPATVHELGENSPMVSFEQGGMTVVMDRDAFDYTYGDADGPDPAQRDLDALLPRVTRVCVLEGAMFRGRAMGGPILIDTRDADALRKLASCLQIVEDPQTFGHCSCLGGPTMELYAGPEHLATIGLQHGRAIRWKQWYHDAQLQDGGHLSRWLHEQGVEPARLEGIFQRGDNFLYAEASVPSAPQKEAQQLCSQARERAQAGQLAEALQLSTQALGLEPDHEDAYALRAQVNYHLGRSAEAAADCTAAIDRGLRHPEVYFLRAVALDDAGRTDEALADCSMALHLNPEHAGAFNSRGLIRARLGRPEEALADFAEAIRIAPEWILPRVHRAQLYHGRGELDAALADYNQAVALVQQAAPSAAVADNDAMLALVYCRRGEARYDQFREEEAEADFAEARGRHPETAAHYLGEMGLRRSKYEKSREAFAELVRLRPQDAQGYLGRGMAQEALGDLEGAGADYSAAIGLQPEGGSGYFLRARVRQRQGRSDDALADLSEHLRLHPQDVMACLTRSALHKERKAWAAALEDLNAAHRGAPESPEVCNQLAWLLATCPDPQFRDGARSVTLARQACQATGWNHPSCLDTLAAAFAETGARDEALLWQAKAIELSPKELNSERQARMELYRAGQAYRE